MAADDYAASEGSIQRVLVPAYAKQLSPATQLAIQRASSEPGPEGGTKLPATRPEDMLGSAALDSALEESGPGGTGELSRSLGFIGSPCRIRGTGQKNSRRKRDLVLSVSELSFSHFFLLQFEERNKEWVDFKPLNRVNSILNPIRMGGIKRPYSITWSTGKAFPSALSFRLV